MAFQNPYAPLVKAAISGALGQLQKRAAGNLVLLAMWHAMDGAVGLVPDSIYDEIANDLEAELKALLGRVLPAAAPPAGG
jgi:hypothetical protein